jgi:hypothetical protein
MATQSIKTLSGLPIRGGLPRAVLNKLIFSDLVVPAQAELARLTELLVAETPLPKPEIHLNTKLTVALPQTFIFESPNAEEKRAEAAPAVKLVPASPSALDNILNFVSKNAVSRKSRINKDISMPIAEEWISRLAVKCDNPSISRSNYAKDLKTLLNGKSKSDLFGVITLLTPEEATLEFDGSKLVMPSKKAQGLRDYLNSDEERLMFLIKIPVGEKDMIFNVAVATPEKNQVIRYDPSIWVGSTALQNITGRVDKAITEFFDRELRCKLVPTPKYPAMMGFGAKWRGIPSKELIYDLCLVIIDRIIAAPELAEPSFLTSANKLDAYLSALYKFFIETALLLGAEPKK